MAKLEGKASPPTKPKKVAALTAAAGDGTGANSTAADASGNAPANEAPTDSPKTPRGRRGRKGSIAYVLHPSAAMVMAAAASCLAQPASSYWTPNSDSALHVAPAYNAMVNHHCSNYDVTEPEWTVFAKNTYDYEVFREATLHQTMIFV